MHAWCPGFLSQSLLPTSNVWFQKTLLLFSKTNRATPFKMDDGGLTPAPRTYTHRRWICLVGVLFIQLSHTKLQVLCCIIKSSKNTSNQTTKTKLPLLSDPYLPHEVWSIWSQFMRLHLIKLHLLLSFQKISLITSPYLSFNHSHWLKFKPTMQWGSACSFLTLKG